MYIYIYIYHFFPSVSVLHGMPWFSQSCGAHPRQAHYGTVHLHSFDDEVVIKQCTDWKPGPISISIVVSGPAVNVHFGSC